MTNTEIGSRLRGLRESKNDENGRRLSQGKLIEAFINHGIKITQSKLSGLENGEITVTPDIIIFYSLYFNVSTDFILKGEQQCPNTSVAMPTDMSEYLLNKLEKLETLDQEILSKFVMSDWSTPLNFLKSLLTHYSQKGRWQGILIYFFIILICMPLFNTKTGRLIVITVVLVLYVIVAIFYLCILRYDSKRRHECILKKINEIKRELEL